MSAFVVDVSRMGSELILRGIGPSWEVKAKASQNIWPVMDGASFWSALTRLSVFSYTAKAFILISLFPSGLNLWSGTESHWEWKCIYVCLCASECLRSYLRSTDEIHWRLTCKSSRRMFNPSRCTLKSSWQRWQRFLCVLLRCASRLLFQPQMQRAGMSHCKAEPKGSSFPAFSAGQWRKSPAEQNKKWQRKYSFSCIFRKPLARLSRSTQNLEFSLSRHCKSWCCQGFLC